MTPQQFIGVAVRLFAVWLAIHGIEMLLAGVSLVFVYIPTYIASLFYLIVAALLWFFPMAVAHKLLPRTQFENTLKIPLQETVVVACIILGIWTFATQALPAISAYINMLVQAKIDDIPFAQSWLMYARNLPNVVMSFVISVILCFKAHSIAAYLIKVPVPRQEWVEEE